MLFRCPIIYIQARSRGFVFQRKRSCGPYNKVLISDTMYNSICQDVGIYTSLEMLPHASQAHGQNL